MLHLILTPRKTGERMAGKTHIEIQESPQQLEKLMAGQKASRKFIRVQCLYLLKTGKAATITEVAELVGRHRVTVHRWLNCYQKGGVETLLGAGRILGRPPKVPVEVAAKLQQELRDTAGFKSYGEVRLWLLALHDICVSYATAYRLAHDELQSKLKVPRPSSIKRQPKTVKEFKRTLRKKIRKAKEMALKRFGTTVKCTYWVQDETRIGMKTIFGKTLTLKGVKPIGKHQWGFDNYYIYGVVEPKTGRLFWCEFSHLDGDCFEKFLEEVSRQYPEEVHIIQVDNAGAHIKKEIQIPDNVILIFQPSHSPDLNPIERLWEELKDFLEWKIFQDLDDLKRVAGDFLESRSPAAIQSLTGWDFILRSLSVTGL